MWEWRDLKEIFIKNGFEYEEHLDILVDLNKNEEELWKEVNTKGEMKLEKQKKKVLHFS